MCTQYPIRVLPDVKCILHIACWMILGHIERCKVVPVVFYFRTGGNTKAYFFKNRNDLFFNYTQRMAGTNRQRCPRECNIYILAFIIIIFLKMLKRFILSFG